MIHINDGNQRVTAAGKFLVAVTHRLRSTTSLKFGVTVVHGDVQPPS